MLPGSPGLPKERSRVPMREILEQSLVLGMACVSVESALYAPPQVESLRRKKNYQTDSGQTRIKQTTFQNHCVLRTS
eukprot:6448136-Amphidinium_carterae.1